MSAFFARSWAKPSAILAIIAVIIGSFSSCQRDAASGSHLDPALRATLRDTAIGYAGCDKALYRAMPGPVYEYYYPGYVVYVTPLFNNASQKVKVVADGVKFQMDFTEKNIVHFAGLYRDKYFFDLAAAPEEKEVAVFNAQDYTILMRSKYLGTPPAIESGKLKYLFSIGETAATEKGLACPDAATWKAQGHTVGYGQYWTMDLTTLAEEETGKFDCVVVK